MDDSFGTAFAIDPSQIPNDSVVLTSNALGQPIVMSKDQLLNGIPSSAPLRQAFHCLEIYNGHLSKYSPAKFAVWFAFERRGQDPNDVDLLSLQSVDPVPMALAKKMGLTEERLEMAVRNRMMILLLMDKKNPVPTILEFHQIPDKDWVKPDEHWFWQVKMYKSNLT
ncbi:uncharacterized protein C8R40DRAFT_1178226 [Lentinula edodes]|uniref:uncharacterized protein n=1 Tax=Lentinula edodes TaxID=5353 RepID=UPI001E8D88F2|nr:uncharacterized protein C8R40DRAFT_1178226 [Lentinula edodes]KAH7868112.1 hypothetical protein C8R40DRAFT_1178226 [Lentinula edodes]